MAIMANTIKTFPEVPTLLLFAEVWFPAQKQRKQLVKWPSSIFYATLQFVKYYIRHTFSVFLSHAIFRFNHWICYVVHLNFIVFRFLRNASFQWSRADQFLDRLA